MGEGDRVKQDEVVARLDTRDIELALRRAEAERQQAEAQLRLLQAGARPEEIRQAQAQVSASGADVAGAEVELSAAELDLRRFEALLETNAGSQKQRDDAATRRRPGARARGGSAATGSAPSREVLARLEVGARREEIEAARARVASQRRRWPARAGPRGRRRPIARSRAS